MSYNNINNATYCNTRTRWYLLFFVCLRTGLLCVFFVVFFLYIYFDTINNRYRLMPLVGLSVFILVGFAFSKHRRNIDWTTVATGLATQITIGLLTVRWPIGRSIVQAVGEKAEHFFSFAYIGAQVTYGHELIDVYGVFAFKVSMLHNMFPLYNTVHCYRIHPFNQLIIKLKINKRL